MTQSELLKPLVDAIETVKRRITEHGTSLRENETRTRVALIDPILRALGWDVSEPGSVTLEFDVQGRRADYALLRANNRPAATIEAKKLGEALATHRMQMLNYANASGVDYAGLTDGNHWELYDVFKRGELSERELLSVTIADAPSHESALKLLRLWQPNLASGAPVEAERPVLEASGRDDGQPHGSGSPDGMVSRNESIVDAYKSGKQTVQQIAVQHDHTPERIYEILRAAGLRGGQFAPSGWEPPEAAPPPIPISRSASEGEWTSVEVIQPNQNNRPSKLKLPDGTEQNVRFWRDVMLSLVEWLYKNERLLPEHLPLLSDRGAIMANSDGSRMRESKKANSAPIYVEVNLNGPGIGNALSFLVTKFRLSPASVQVRLRE